MEKCEIFLLKGGKFHVKMQKSAKVAENIVAFVCVLTNYKSEWAGFVCGDTNEGEKIHKATLSVISIIMKYLANFCFIPNGI